MATYIKLFVGWAGIDEIESVLTVLLGEPIGLSGGIFAGLEPRVTAHGLVLHGHDDFTDEHTELWMLSADMLCSIGLSERDGLYGLTLDLERLAVIVDAAEAFAQTHSLPAPRLHHTVISD